MKHKSVYEINKMQQYIMQTRPVLRSEERRVGKECM